MANLCFNYTKILTNRQFTGIRILSKQKITSLGDFLFLNTALSRYALAE